MLSIATTASVSLSATLDNGFISVSSLDEIRPQAANGSTSDSFDVISEMTWSNSFGFLEKGADIRGMIRSLETDMDYYAPVR